MTSEICAVKWSLWETFRSSIVSYSVFNWFVWFNSCTSWLNWLCFLSTHFSLIIFFIKTEVFKFKFKAPSSPTHQCVACEEPGDGQKCQQKFHIDKVLTEPPLHTRVARRRNFLTFFSYSSALCWLRCVVKARKLPLNDCVFRAVVIPLYMSFGGKTLSVSWYFFFCFLLLSSLWISF